MSVLWDEMSGRGKTNHPAAVEREEDSMSGVRVQRFSDILRMEGDEEVRLSVVFSWGYDPEVLYQIGKYRMREGRRELLEILLGYLALPNNKTDSSTTLYTSTYLTGIHLHSNISYPHSPLSSNNTSHSSTNSSLYLIITSYLSAAP